MTKQKVGLVIFWISIIWAITWGVILSIFNASTMHSLTWDELSQSIWAIGGPLNMLWGVFGVTLGAIIAGIGLLLYSGAKTSTVWKFGIGIFLTYIITIMVLPAIGYFPPLFGILGTLILLFFIGILWFWAKERMALKGSSTTAMDFRLVGYVFMLIAVYFTCGIAGQPFVKAGQGMPPTNPLYIITFFVLGFGFLFLSHYKSRKQQA